MVASTRKEALLFLQKAFEKKNMDTPALDARWLLQAALNISQEDLILSPMLILLIGSPTVYPPLFSIFNPFYITIVTTTPF